MVLARPAWKAAEFSLQLIEVLAQFLYGSHDVAHVLASAQQALLADAHLLLTESLAIRTLNTAVVREVNELCDAAEAAFGQKPVVAEWMRVTAARGYAFCVECLNEPTPPRADGRRDIQLGAALVTFSSTAVACPALHHSPVCAQPRWAEHDRSTHTQRSWPSRPRQDSL